MNKKTLISSFALLVALLLLFWAPWSGKNLITKLKSTENYSQTMNRIGNSIYCDIKSSWQPFGRKIEYCDRAEWSVIFWGKITFRKNKEFIPNQDYQEKMKKFDFYISDNKNNLCDNWNKNYQVTTIAKLIKLTLSDESSPSNLAVLRFEKDGREQNFLFPSEKIDADYYHIGNSYEIDMNNVCIYYTLTSDINNSAYREYFSYPKLVE